MTRDHPAVNILTSYDVPLFTQHFDAARDGFVVTENGSPDREWALLIVFEGFRAPATYKVRGGRAIFVSGEPPEIGNQSRTFLRQFDQIYSANAPLTAARRVSHEQHFNNWHFGYSADRSGFRYDRHAIEMLPAPVKSLMLSTITSNLNYMPMHIKRRALVTKLARDYAGQIDIFGRPHRFVEYKEDAILPYRFHLCVENCSLPGLWTEKIADALLGFAIPVYAGCPDIDRYFPGATINIDLDDYVSARRTMDTILTDGEAMYREMLPALMTARTRLIEDFDISALVARELKRNLEHGYDNIMLRPAAALPFARSRDLLAQAHRKATALIWRRRIAIRG